MSLRESRFKLIEGFGWILMSICFLALASIFAKQAGIVTKGKGLLSIIVNSWYLFEIIALFLQACCWIMALRFFSLSFAYPFMSLVFVFNLFSAWFIFNEPLFPNHLLGILLISAGVFLISKTIHR